MSEIENAAPAGASDGASAPMTIDAAASLLAGWDDEPEQAAAQPEAPAPQAEEAVADEPVAEVVEETTEDHQPEENTEPQEPSAYDWEKVPGDAKFRLRDGTELTAADLKRDFDDLRRARALKEEYENNTRQFQQQQARFAQEAQQFAQIAPRAIAALKASLPEIPPYPGDELLNDPIAYQEALHKRNQAIMTREQKIAEIRQIEHAAQVQQAQRQQQEQAQKDRYIKEQHELLLQKMPHLKDKEKLGTFVNDVTKFGVETYGFKPDELDIVDHRVVQVIADAIAYRKLQSAPPKPVNAQPAPKTTPAVAAPGKRQGTGDAEAQKRQAALQNVRKTGGSIDSVAAAIAALDL